MAASTHLMTVEEFQRLPEDRGETYHELHHGEIVTLTRPKYKHWLIRSKLADLLRPLAEPGSRVGLAMAFRPQPVHECWAADVAYLSAERARLVDREDYIHGAPDLVIEVLSPSNTAAEILDREQICVANGSREFWVIDPLSRRVRVTTWDGRAATYQADQRIPVIFGPEAWLNVDDIFRD